MKQTRQHGAFLDCRARSNLWNRQKRFSGQDEFGPKYGCTWASASLHISCVCVCVCVRACVRACVCVLFVLLQPQPQTANRYRKVWQPSVWLDTAFHCLTRYFVWDNGRLCQARQTVVKLCGFLLASPEHLLLYKIFWRYQAAVYVDRKLTGNHGWEMIVRLIRSARTPKEQPAAKGSLG